jgi:RecQ-mediated genome instability protein 1
MLAGTGLPIHITQSDHKEANTRLGGSPILVEIAAITEITHSAYQLDQIRIVREDRMRAGQTDDDEGEGDLEVEGEGPMPKYPRGMLKFELSDGTTTLSAIEYRSLPEIALGRTQLGYKASCLRFHFHQALNSLLWSRCS